ncbi:MAG TPA: glycosyltransferase [Chryseosolibacter sp.]|nr:glycosyltransferase [Chryseosolibacter sp.]
MADSNKSTVVIASVLKPVDDSRWYEKIGLSLASTGKYEVHIIGVGSAGVQVPNIRQHPMKPFGRLSPRRLFARWKIMVKAMRLSPDLFIVATHELLYLAVFLKIVKKCRIIYDVQENYFWNILYTPVYPLLIKPFAALYVRGKEIITSGYIDHFFLADRGYLQELKFPGSRCTLLENKVRIVPPEKSSPVPLSTKKTISLIFSGTLAETAGVFTAIDLAIKLHVIDDRFRLTIIGFASQKKVLEKIRLLIQPRPFIDLITSDNPIPHKEIFKQIQKADFGLITYQINPSTMNSIPTKLYEYLGFKLPVLLVNHKPWVEFCVPYSAAVVFDSLHFDAGQIYRQMTSGTFYTADPSIVYWDSEEPKLLRVVDDLLTPVRQLGE